jgi:hypothetical protein
MKKIDIRDRVLELEQRLVKRKDTLTSQSDERNRLTEACRTSGDHVFEWVITGSGVVQACEFCHLAGGASTEQLRRNLSVG